MGEVGNSRADCRNVAPSVSSPNSMSSTELIKRPPLGEGSTVAPSTRGGDSSTRNECDDAAAEDQPCAVEAMPASCLSPPPIAVSRCCITLAACCCAAMTCRCPAALLPLPNSNMRGAPGRRRRPRGDGDAPPLPESAPVGVSDRGETAALPLVPGRFRMRRSAGTDAVCRRVPDRTSPPSPLEGSASVAVAVAGREVEEEEGRRDVREGELLGMRCDRAMAARRDTSGLVRRDLAFMRRCLGERR